MPSTNLFEFNNSDGQWNALVPLEGQGNFIFNGKKVKFLDVTVYKAGPNVGTETSLREHGLELQIPMTPMQFARFEASPSATFEIVNDFEFEERQGEKFDIWIVEGRDWSRDVYNEQGNDLKDRVLYTFFPTDSEDALPA